MKLTCTAVPELPKLAWLAVVEPAKRTTRVLHGPLVESGPGFFVEGVWDGAFADGQFATTDSFFGSGGVSGGDDEVSFITSAATTDYLYYAQDATQVAVSNSLSLLLAHRGDRLDPQCTTYDDVNLSITRGIELYQREIPSTRGGLRRLMVRNLRVTSSGIVEYEKVMPPPFSAYEAYYEYVVAAYGRIAANARDTSRRNPMNILSTQSRGYDTTAVNAVAARFGVDRAFTVTRAKPAGAFAEREESEGPSDDGTEICGVLGIPCVPIDRRSFKKTDFDDEYLYYAALDANQDVNMRAIAKQVNGAAILLTGALGELWYTYHSFSDAIRKYSLVNDELRRGDLGGHGLTEVRLAAGFVQVAVPYIGARRRVDIAAITESAAMNDWRLNTSYDRPIPRRLAEDAGVPREMFGQVKLASVVEFTPPPIPYGSQLRSDYFKFLVANRLVRSWEMRLFPMIHQINTLLTFAGEQRYAWLWYSQRAISKIIRRDYRFPRLWKRLNGALFCMCANRRADEYATMIRMA